MKVLLLGAGASKAAGYPSTKELMQTIGNEVANSGNTLLDAAWEKWKHLRARVTEGRIKTMLDSTNPEVFLSLIDLYQAALAEKDPQKPSMYVETREGILECLRWFFTEKHKQARPRETKREYLRKKLGELSVGDVVITFNWDTIVERTLMEEGLWVPTDGYGFRKRLRVGTAQYSRPLEVDNSKTAITVLKLHGSVGWYSLNGDKLYLDSRDFLSAFPFASDASQTFDADEPPLSQTISTGSVMAYPSFLKRLQGREMQQIWRLADLRLLAADSIEVWGYSLPNSDVAARTLLNPLRFRLGRAKLKMNVHDPDDHVLTRWCKFLGTHPGLKLLSDKLE
jgi:hypothetical protein